MVAYPNAKINLGLRVTGKRPDGYHELETVFYPVDWCDILEALPADGTAVFTSSGIPIPGDEQSNLCLKAVALLKEGRDLPPVSIHLHKLIPMGAGLGGGSSDGAFMLRMLNDLFNLQLKDETLAALALRLGSDCPFFIQNKPVWATGRGEELTAIPLSLKGHSLVIVKPPVHVSTAEAFSRVKPAVPGKSIRELILKPLTEWKNVIINDFEEPIFSLHPEIGQLKELFYRHGALFASMSGSGSSVYGIFDGDPGRLPLPESWPCWSGLLN